MRNTLLVSLSLFAATRTAFAQQQRTASPSPQTIPAVVTTVTGLRDGWWTSATESPDGRFVVVEGFSADSAFMRLDMRTRTWARIQTSVDGVRPNWSPDGRFLAFSGWTPASKRSQIWLLPMNAQTGLPISPVRRVSNVHGSMPTWSPDGRQIAFVSGDSGRFAVIRIPFNGGDADTVYSGTGGAQYPSWSPNGRHIFFQHTRPRQPVRVLRVDIAARRADSLFTGDGRLVGPSPDGRTLAMFNSQGQVVVLLSAQTGQPVRRLTVPNETVPIGWSRTVPGALTGIEHVVPATLRRMSLPDGLLRTISPLDSSIIDEILLSPDQRKLAYVRSGRTPRIIIADTAGRVQRSLTLPIAPLWLGWSPDGRWLAYHGARRALHVVDVATGADRVIKRVTAAGVGLSPFLAWRADSRSIVYAENHAAPEGRIARFGEVTLAGVDRSYGTSVPMRSASRFHNDTLLVQREGSAFVLVHPRTGRSRTIGDGVTGSGGQGVIAAGEWLPFVTYEDDRPVPGALSLLTGQVRRFPWSLAGDVNRIELLPDERHMLAYACLNCPNGTEKWELVLAPLNGDPPRVLTSALASFPDLGSPVVSADGRTVYFEAEHSYNSRLVTIRPPQR